MSSKWEKMLGSGKRGEPSRSGPEATLCSPALSGFQQVAVRKTHLGAGGGSGERPGAGRWVRTVSALRSHGLQEEKRATWGQRRRWLRETLL